LESRFRNSVKPYDGGLMIVRNLTFKGGRKTKRSKKLQSDHGDGVVLCAGGTWKQKARLLARQTYRLSAAGGR
jgi:hypothetical protein